MTDEPRRRSGRASRVERDERIRRDVEGEREPVARGLEERAFEVLALGEGQGMDEDVERVVGLAPALEDGRDLLVRPDVARLDEGRADRFGERADALLDAGSRPTRSRPRRPRRGAPGRSPRRSSGRWRRRRSAPSCRRAVPSRPPACRRGAAYHRADDRERTCRRAPRGAARCARLRPRCRRRARPAGRAAARVGGGGRLARGARHPVPRRDELLAAPPRDARGWFEKGGLRDRPGPDHHRDVGDRRLHRGDPPRSAAVRAGRRPMRGASSPASGSSTPTRRMPLPEGSVAAVVVGDAGDDLSYRNMDVAFRLVRGGAELLAMHRNPWWLTATGITLDAGAFVVGLEFATGRPRADPRQAVAGRVPPGGRRAGGRPRRAAAAVGLRDGRRRPEGRRRGRPAGRPARVPRPVRQDDERGRRAGRGWPESRPGSRRGRRRRWPTSSPR